jgi:hypothetical protein
MVTAMNEVPGEDNDPEEETTDDPGQGGVPGVASVPTFDIRVVHADPEGCQQHREQDPGPDHEPRLRAL